MITQKQKIRKIECKCQVVETEEKMKYQICRNKVNITKKIKPKAIKPTRLCNQVSSKSV
jgi:hypothetical protein